MRHAAAVCCCLCQRQACAALCACVLHCMCMCCTVCTHMPNMEYAAIMAMAAVAVIFTPLISTYGGDIAPGSCPVLHVHMAAQPHTVDRVHTCVHTDPR